MSEFTVMLLRFALVALLWLFVLGVASVIRRDLYGPRRTRAERAAARRASSSRTPAPEAPRTPATPVAAAAGASAAPAFAAPDDRAPTRVRVTVGPLRGLEVALGTSPITLGRSADNTVVIDDDYASGRHARIVPDLGGWALEDLGSTNGTYVGDERVTGRIPLRVGMPVTIGHTTLELAA